MDATQATAPETAVTGEHPLTAELRAAARNVRALDKPAAEDATSVNQLPTDETAPEAVEVKDKKADKDEAPETEERLSPQIAALKRQEKKHLEQRNAWENEKGQISEQLDAAKHYIGKVDALAAGFLGSPVPLARALGATKPEHFQALAEAFWIEAVGPENAPAEWKGKIEQNSIHAQLAKLQADNESLRNEMMQRETQRQQVGVESEYRAELSAALTAATEDAPHVAAFAQGNAGELLDALFTLADNIAAQEKKIPDAARVVSILESNLEEEYSRLGGLYERKKKPNTPPSGKQARTTTRTLSNATTPPESGRPRAPAKNDEERIQRAASVFGELRGLR